MAFSDVAPQAGPANTNTVRYIVGIRFSPLGNPDENSDSYVSVKHWSLVFTPIDDLLADHTVEAYPNLKRKLAFLHRQHDTEIESFELAEYQGSPSDIERVLEAHPARGSVYSACYNNCQHFAATFLHLLQAFANQALNKTFRIVDPERMRTVQSVLVSEDLKLYNRPNMLLQFGVEKILALSGAGVAGLTMASEATVLTPVVSAVTSTTPMSGIAGWFGGTVSTTTYVTNLVATPAAFASTAALAAAAVAGATVAVGGGYLLHRHSWKKYTMFKDPRSHGFPEEELGPLTPAERMQREDMESKTHISLFGSSSVGIPKELSAKVAAKEFTIGVIDDLMKETEELMKEVDELMKRLS
jgi:hypothetical protein